MKEVMRPIALVVLMLFPHTLRAADRIIGANAPAGGALLAKHFVVLPNMGIEGVSFVSNDLRTVFPRIALLRGRVDRLERAETLIEWRNVGANSGHCVELRFPRFHFATATDIMVAVEMPPSSGVVSKGHGDGVLATRLEAPGESYFASSVEGDLGRMDVDYEINLILDAEKLTIPGTELQREASGVRTFLRVGASNTIDEARTIILGLSRASRVTLTVYDVAGHKVRLLIQEELGKGIHVREWDSLDGRGQEVGPGIYFIHMQADGALFTVKMLVIK